jgi:hypothetical protein
LTVLSVYTGDGYTIGYPQGWTVVPAGTIVTFTDPTKLYHLAVIVTPNPGGAASADTFASASIDAARAKLTNPQTENGPPTTTVGGETWVQKAVSGTTNVNGQSTVVQTVLISDNHPASSPMTRNFIIVGDRPEFGMIEPAIPGISPSACACQIK